MTTQSVAPRRTTMTTFTIDDQNSITAFGSAEETTAATATPFDSFASQKELAGLVAGWPAERLVAVWNGLPGVEPVKKFKNTKIAASRIWERIQSLGEAATPVAEPAQSRTRIRTPNVAHKPRRARPPRPRRARRPPLPRIRPRRKRRLRRRNPPVRAKAARRPKWSRCSKGRAAPHWLRSWTRWAGNGTPSAGSWPAR